VAAADSAATAAAAVGKTAGNPVDKRLAKRHKRQVSRAREKVRLSEPDLRTPDRIAAARLASRPDLRREQGPWPSLPSAAPTNGSKLDGPDEV
jgi:hypothetical protein